MVKKILLVEDDPDIREVVTYILEQDGYMVEALPVTQPADLVGVQEPQLLLMDEWLPESPRHRLCLALKATAFFRHIPVIILSTANDIEKIVRDCGADDFIRKPFDLDELLNKVHACLD